MSDYRTILVPVDFSEHSREALEEATRLAKTFGAELHLLHCYSVPPSALSPYGVMVPESLDREIRTAASTRLREWAEKARASGCEVEQRVIAHFPVDEILEHAERIGADLIVMGTRGLTGIKHALLGSVAERTLRGASCPVLTVKADDEGAQR